VDWCRHWTVDPSSDLYYRWLAIITLAAVYNLTLIVGRTVLPDLQDKYRAVWITLDYVCDLIYVLDVVVRFRTSTCHLALLQRHMRGCMQTRASPKYFGRGRIAVCF